MGWIIFSYLIYNKYHTIFSHFSGVVYFHKLRIRVTCELKRVKTDKSCMCHHSCHTRIYSNKRPTSNKHPPPSHSHSNSNKRSPPPYPPKNWISTNKRPPRRRSFLQSILQEPCLVTSSSFVVTIYCFVACRLFSRGVIFTRARVSLALLSIMGDYS